MMIDRSDVVAFAALFVALGGTGLAAVGQLRPRSVTTAALQDRAVTPIKIADGAISQRTIHVRAVGPRQLAPGAVTHFAIAPGEVFWENLSLRVHGSIAAGEALASTRIGQRFEALRLVSDGATDHVISCNTGFAVSGGFTLPSNSSVKASYQSDSKQSWVLRIVTTGTAGSGARGYVVCMI